MAYTGGSDIFFKIPSSMAVHTEDPSASTAAPAASCAPWIRAQCLELAASPGQALLLHGPSGLGQYRLALELARAWLCEAPSGQLACGACTSCHAIDVRTHADLCVLMPETTMLALQWPLSEKAQGDIDDKKRKPSREIRIDALRDAIEFAQRTSARGRAKVVLVYPAEHMNTIAANALLKTLEEPPGQVRFVLATESTHQLLPTIRSRCLGHSMQWPQHAEAVAWLTLHGLDASAAAHYLRLSGDRPEDALAMAQSGLALATWSQFPLAMAAGNVNLVRDWPAAVLLDGLHKLCHDAMVRWAGAAPRFFSAETLRALPPASLPALLQWNASLRATSRNADHPFHAGLMQEALVEQARIALNSARTRP